MNRLNRKNKANLMKNTTTSDSVHSGHYMTSSLQNDDTVEMPIASPDATHNEVTLSVDQENENILVASSSQTQLDTSGGQIKSTSGGAKLVIDDDDDEVAKLSAKSVKSSAERVNDESSAVLKEPNKAESSTQISGMMSSKSGLISSTGSTLAGKPSQNRTGFTARIEIGGVMKTISIVTEDGSISGGLTLYDKTNKSLKNLIYYIKVAYSNNLTSPKWKNFKGLRLQVTEKIRLNNVIWRGWFEQYGRDKQQRNAGAATSSSTTSAAGKRQQQQLICQFTNVFDDDAPPKTTKMSAGEGKFWKAKLEAITNEYKKWRAISRKQIKSIPADGNSTKPTSNEQAAIPSSQPTAQSSSTSLSATLSNKETSNSSNTSLTTSSYSSSIKPIDDSMKISTSSSIPSNLTSITSPATSSYTTATLPNNNSTGNLATSFNNFDSSFNQPILNNNNNSNYINMYEGGNQVTFYNQNNEYTSNTMVPNSTGFASNTQGNFGYINNEYGMGYGQQNMGGYVSQPAQSTSVVVNKQIPYNNRYPSPSPGLFQDIDLYTDTLFSTYQVEDPKGNIFGNNPDLFQPDLMHLHPTFDFLDFIDLDIDLKNLDNNNNTSAGIILEPSPPPTSQTPVNQPNKTISGGRNSSKQKQMMKNEQMVKSNSASVDTSATTASQPSGNIIVPVWDDINTLAAVAAAQSTASSNTSGHQDMSIEIISKKDNTKFGVLVHESAVGSNPPPLTASTSSPGVLSSSVQQLKMPVSLSQINTSINNHSTRRHSINPLPLDKNSAMSSNVTTSNSNSGSTTIRDLLNTPLIKSSFNESNKSKVKPDESNLIDAVTELNKLQHQHQLTGSKKPFNTSTSLDKSSNKMLSLPIIVDEKSQKSKPVGKRARKASNPVNQSTIRSSTTTDMTPSSNEEDNVYEESSSGNSRKKMNSSTSGSKFVSMSEQSHQGYFGTKSKGSGGDKSNDLYERELSETSLKDSKKVRSSLLDSDGLKSQKIESPVTMSVSTPLNTISRSNSMNSLNDSSSFLALGNAEQKRRCNIQQGFDRLQILVPSLKDKNAKVSKAVMLQKTSDYIKELQRAREKRVADLSVYKREIEQLSEKITECQNMLPASGVSVTGNLNRVEKFEQRFSTYVREKTLENWKFYMFSLFLRPLFDTFVNSINTSSKETIDESFYDWQQKHCNLVQLRPIAANVLRYISRSTSILTDSSKLPEESYKAVLTNI